MKTQTQSQLAIAIPCYKRPDFLKLCLSSIVKAAGGMALPIYVVDDSCDTTNDEMLATFGAQHPHLHVIKNEKNLGIDRNICKCLEVADAQYVWLIGEDDLMRPNAVARLQASGFIEQGHPFIFANYSYVAADQRHVFREKSIDIDADRDMPFDDFFSEYLWAAGFIGGCIFRRDSFLSVDYPRFLGTYYAHVGGLSLSSLGKRVGVIAEPLVYNRVGDAATFTWSSDSYGVFQGWRVLLRMLSAHVSAELLRAAWASHKRAHGYLGPKFLIAKKADGLLQWPHLREIWRSDCSAIEKTLAGAGFLFPSVMARGIRSGYAALRRTQLKVRADG